MTYRYRIALIFLLGFFIDCINIFMSAITLPAIAEAMQVSSLSVTWVANSYILGLTLIIPLSPRLAARFGIRELMTASMLLFAAAAVTDFSVFSGARAEQNLHHYYDDRADSTRAFPDGRRDHC
ncbi:hypothetical protein LH673_00785 [Morganella morganii]|nr:MFS transporter [Morganella morganii]MCF1263944.1 hypothetical protein [Morganella morganii]